MRILCLADDQKDVLQKLRRKGLADLATGNAQSSCSSYPGCDAGLALLGVNLLQVRRQQVSACLQRARYSRQQTLKKVMSRL